MNVSITPLQWIRATEWRYNERVDPVPEGPNESSLARSAWKQDKSRPVPEGRLICLTSPRAIFRLTLRRALLEKPDTPLEKFESDDVRPDGGCW
jgi:hypothetical protein